MGYVFSIVCDKNKQNYLHKPNISGQRITVTDP